MWYCYFDSFSSGQIDCYCVPWFTTFRNGDGDGFLLLLRLWHLMNRFGLRHLLLLAIKIHFTLLLGHGVGVWHKWLDGHRHGHGDGWLGTWLRRDRHLKSLAWANTVWDRNSHETRGCLDIQCISCENVWWTCHCTEETFLSVVTIPQTKHNNSTSNSTSHYLPDMS